MHIFDLLKKGWFSLPFLAIIALLLFLRNLTFLVFRTVPLSLYTVSGNGTIPIFPISAACAALLLSFFFLHSLLHLTPSRLDRLSYHYIILPFSLQIKNYRYYQHHNTYRNKQDADKNPLLSHFGMDNRTHEGVTERTDKHFPRGHCSQQKRVSRVNCTVLRLPLTLFFLWLLGN